MKQTLLSFTCFLIGLSAIECSAQTNQIFIPNLGQVLTTDSTPTARSFYAQIPGGTVYLSEDTVSFVYAQIDASEATDDTLYRFDMRFISPFGTPAFRATDTSDFYYNFWYPHCDTGITGVLLLGQLDVDQIWQGVDLSYISTDDGYITRFTVAPEWGTSAIQWQFDGLDSATIGQVGEMQLHTPLGAFYMPPPIAYSGNDTFTAMYTRNGSSFGMAQQGWSGLQDMHFEWRYARSGGAGPCGGNCEWSTYYGGFAGDEFTDANTDGDNNLCLTGWTNSIDFPLVPGMALFDINQGQSDAVVLKFNELGERLWATYFGGTGADQGVGITNDNDNNVFVTGYTLSQDLPTADPGGGAYYQSQPVGANQIFMMKLPASGDTLYWSTYYGGTGQDVVYGIASDTAGNIFITGETTSFDFPVKDPGAGAYYQGSHSGPVATSEHDAFIVKFSAANLDTAWATYYGGPWSSNERGLDIHVSEAGDVFVVGTTVSDSFPIFNPGAPAYCDSSSNGMLDAFIIRFTNAGVRLWSTYYGGSATDFAAGIVTGSRGELFVTGGTSSLDFPTQQSGSAYYQATKGTPHPSMTDAFLLGFDANMGLTWSTYCGGSSPDEGVDLAVDSNSYLYLCGTTQSSDFPFPPAPQGFYFAPYTGAFQDAFLFVFDSVQHEIWGTYVGGPSPDWSRATTIDNNNKVFVIGRTGSLDFPLNDGGGVPYFQSTLQGLSDGFITRFNMDGITVIGEAPVAASSQSISLYPNPARDRVRMRIDPGSQPAVLTISNSIGQVVQVVRIDQHNSETTLALSGWPRGLYFVALHCGEERLVQKLILQ